MHSFLIAACFVLIVLSPCVAAQFNETRTSPPQPSRKQLRLTRLREKLAPVEVDELEDPCSSTALQQRAERLDDVRSSRVRRIQLAAGRPGSAASRSPVVVR